SNWVVEPIKSAIFNTGSSHSGCAINLAFGCVTFNLVIFSRLKISCTIHAPFQSSIFLPVTLLTQAPRFLSGAKIIGWSGGKLSTIAFALLLVQITSLRALIPALQLI